MKTTPFPFFKLPHPLIKKRTIHTFCDKVIRSYSEIYPCSPAENKRPLHHDKVSTEPVGAYFITYKSTNI